MGFPSNLNGMSTRDSGGLGADFFGLGGENDGSLGDGMECVDSPLIVGFSYFKFALTSVVYESHK